MDTPIGASILWGFLCLKAVSPLRAAQTIKSNPLKDTVMNEVQEAFKQQLVQQFKSLIKETVIEACWECIPYILEDYETNKKNTIRLYSRKEVCEKLDICKATYHNWIKRKKLTGIQIGGRVYVDARKLDQAIEKGIIKKGSQQMFSMEEDQNEE